MTALLMQYFFNDTIRRYKMSETSEKDNFWLYIGVLVVVLVGVLLTVKSSEHDKYELTKKAIKEDTSFNTRQKSQ